jgi:RNA polymerase sigma-70 factor (ECF subfamily)
LTREEDYEYVRHLRSEDPGVWRPALGFLFRKYRDRVFNLSVRILREPHLAADATQATFLNVLRKASKFRFRSAFSSWLYRITVNQCIDIRRKKGRAPKLSLSEPEVGEQVGDQDLRRKGTTTPFDEAMRDELQAAIDRAISELDPRMAAVVVLRYSEGMDYHDIALALDLPLGTVKSRLSRAHAALVDRLGPKLDDLV